eukprot:COSAG06_NODE_47690_length_337_cov_1.075630_1_plen_30_part_10
MCLYDTKWQLQGCSFTNNTTPRSSAGGALY